MEQLKQMKEMLIGCVQGQLTHLDTVDAKELGEAVDMIKDLSEAIYYCTVTEAMEGKDKVSGNRETMYYPVMYYREKEDNMGGRDIPRYYGDEMRYMDRYNGRMYYNGQGGGNSSRGGNSSGGYSSSSSSNGTRNYSERDIYLGEMMRDHREGKSPMSRKNYMEGKEMHKEKTAQMHELEKYAQELTSDLMEMIEGASPEEKQMLSSRIATLATKIK